MRELCAELDALDEVIITFRSRRRKRNDHGGQCRKAREDSRQRQHFRSFPRFHSIGPFCLYSASKQGILLIATGSYCVRDRLLRPQARLRLAAPVSPAHLYISDERGEKRGKGIGRGAAAPCSVWRDVGPREVPLSLVQNLRRCASRRPSRSHLTAYGCSVMKAHMTGVGVPALLSGNRPPDISERISALSRSPLNFACDTAALPLHRCALTRV